MGQNEKMNLGPVLSRNQVLKALGVTPLRVRAAVAQQAIVEKGVSAALAPRVAAQTQAVPDKRIALLRTQAEIEQPALAALYTKITEAISAKGLQCVRQADAENDPRVRVLAFGDVVLPESIASSRVLRVDALAALDADRTRKRALWDLIQKIAREAEAG
ncbi:MAG TPA: hypothetical protein VF022_05935 [Rhodanobacteraceae bacterium]|jgi:NAD-specific glutamate dehydrogenase